MPFFLASLCIFLQGVNAAFDVLLICNVNVYELSQRLLLRKIPLDVSYSLYTLPLLSVIHYALPCMINVTSHTVRCLCKALCMKQCLQVTNNHEFVFVSDKW